MVESENAGQVFMASRLVSRRPLDEAQAGGSTLRQMILAEIGQYLELGVDGGFTDYPDLWIEAIKGSAGAKKNQSH